MKLVLTLIMASIGARAAPAYPIEIPGSNANTEMQSFIVDSSGNLALACLSSDLSIVASANTNIVLYWPVSASDWAWTKQLSGVNNEVLADMQLSQSNSAKLAVIYESSLLVVFDTSNGAIVEAHTQPKMTCSLGCSMVYGAPWLLMFGVYTDSGQEYFGFTYYVPETSIPTRYV